MTVRFNPLLDGAPMVVDPVFASTTPELDEEVTANSESIQVVCGPKGLEIPAMVHLESRTVTPILK